MKDACYICAEKKAKAGHISAIAGQSVKNQGWRKPFQLSLSYRDCGGKFCDHSGASDCSAGTIATISAVYISHSPRVGCLSMIRPHKVGQLTHNSENVLEIRSRMRKTLRTQSVCGYEPDFYTDTGTYVQA